jgi:mRNA interferase MazF
MVLSVDAFNAGPSGLVTVLPITSKARVGIPSRIAVVPPEAGLSVPSFIIAEQARTLSVARLGKRLGTLRPATLARVSDAVRMLLGL